MFLINSSGTSEIIFLGEVKLKWLAAWHDGEKNRGVRGGVLMEVEAEDEARIPVWEQVVVRLDSPTPFSELPSI